MPSALAHRVPDFKCIDLGMLRSEGDYASWWVTEDVELGDGVRNGIGDLSGSEHDGTAGFEVAPAYQSLCRQSRVLRSNRDRWYALGSNVLQDRPGTRDKRTRTRPRHTRAGVDASYPLRIDVVLESSQFRRPVHNHGRPLWGKSILKGVRIRLKHTFEER